MFGRINIFIARQHAANTHTERFCCTISVRTFACPSVHHVVILCSNERKYHRNLSDHLINLLSPTALSDSNVSKLGVKYSR